jgi:hypothetical protein
MRHTEPNGEERDLDRILTPEEECDCAKGTFCIVHGEPSKEAPTPTERTPQDYAIEFGGYLADSAEQFLNARNEYDRLNELGDGGDPDMLSDHYRNLTSAIYQFRKRAQKARQP